MAAIAGSAGWCRGVPVHDGICATVQRFIVYRYRTAAQRTALCVCCLKLPLRSPPSRVDYTTLASAVQQTVQASENWSWRRGTGEAS